MSHRRRLIGPVSAALTAVLGLAGSTGMLVSNAYAQVARRPDEDESDGPLLAVATPPDPILIAHRSGHSSHTSHRSHVSGSGGGGGGSPYVAPSPPPTPRNYGPSPAPYYPPTPYQAPAPYPPAPYPPPAPYVAPPPTTPAPSPVPANPNVTPGADTPPVKKRGCNASGFPADGSAVLLGATVAAMLMLRRRRDE